MNKQEILTYIETVLDPKKMSMGTELYSGNVDADSFRKGFNTAKNMVITLLKEELN